MKRLIVLISLLAFHFLSFGQYPEIYFEWIMDKQGLFDQRTNCIIQDKTGFMWIGGVNGLYKYDGYRCTYFKYPPGCSNCSPYGGVLRLQEDNFGNIWILSGLGLVLFNPETEKSLIINRLDSLNSAQNVSLNSGFDLLVDNEGNIWCTDTYGLLRISYKFGFKKEDIQWNNNPERILNITHIDLSRDAFSIKTLS